MIYKKKGKTKQFHTYRHLDLNEGRGKDKVGWLLNCSYRLCEIHHTFYLNFVKKVFCALEFFHKLDSKRKLTNIFTFKTEYCLRTNIYVPFIVVIF